MFIKSIFFRWLLGLGLIVYLLFAIDFNEFFRALSHAEGSWIILAIIATFGDRIFMGVKWRILLVAQGIGVSFWECVRAYFVGSFFGLILPTSVGSDVVRLASLTIREGEREKVAASIIIEKVLGMMAIFTLGTFSVFLLAIKIDDVHWRHFFFILAILLVLVLLFIGSLFFPLFQKVIRGNGKFSKKIASLVEAYQQFRTLRKEMFLFYIVSIVEQMMPVIVTYLLAEALNFSTDFLHYLMVVPLIFIVARLPISVDGLGLLEAMYFLLLPLIGLNKTDAVLLGLVARVLNTLCLLPGGLLYRRKETT